MGIIYVAHSATLGKWGADVGLGKHLYKVGYTEGTPEEAVAGLAGQADWKVLATAPAEADDDEDVLVAPLARKEKPVDPNYYPRLKGARGIFKVNLVNVENHMLVRTALANRQMAKGLKVKPADIGLYLIRNVVKDTDEPG